MTSCMHSSWVSLDTWCEPCRAGASIQTDPKPSKFPSFYNNETIRSIQISNRNQSGNPFRKWKRSSPPAHRGMKMKSHLYTTHITDWYAQVVPGPTSQSSLTRGGQVPIRSDTTPKNSNKRSHRFDPAHAPLVSPTSCPHTAGHTAPHL